MSKGLNKNKLITDLTEIFTPDASKKAESLTPKQVAEKLGNAIHSYVTSGKVKTTVNVTIPQGVVTVGAGVASAPSPQAIPLSGSGDGQIE